MNNTRILNFDIRANCKTNKTGIIKFAHQTIPCVLGKTGIAAHKLEGDGATPWGQYKMLFGFYRPDRIRRLSANIQMVPIKKDFGWCDDPRSPLYNRFIRLPTKWNHEILWREDNLYDICLVLDHNQFPRKRNRGSAIFFHLKHPENKPTEGCIAVSLEHMIRILRQCDSQSRINIHP